MVLKEIYSCLFFATQNKEISNIMLISLFCTIFIEILYIYSFTAYSPSNCLIHIF